MRNATDTNTRYSKGSTVNHAAVPPRSASDGGSGWAPLNDETPPLRKPAVLVTFDPDPSQGTPGTAISADFLNMGSVPSRSWGRRVVLEQLAHWQAQLFGAYLANGLLAITLVFMVRYLRLVIRLINVYWTQLFQVTILPFVVVARFVHDRRYALFRRRAVYTRIWRKPPQIPAPTRSGQPNEQTYQFKFFILKVSIPEKCIIRLC